MIPSFALAVLSPASWLWLNPLSVNLPMSLTSATVVPAVGFALLLPGGAERRSYDADCYDGKDRRPAWNPQNVSLLLQKSRPVSVPCATDDDPSL